MEPLLSFTSHIGGKNAFVRLFPDRLEWSRRGWMSTGAKAGLAVATAGVSYLATGVRGRKDGQVVPVRSISHVSRGNSLLQDRVTISTAGGDIVMRVARREADALVDALNALIAGVHPAQQPQSQYQQPAPDVGYVPPPPPVPAQPVTPPQPVLPAGMTWEQYFASPAYAEWYRLHYGQHA